MLVQDIYNKKEKHTHSTKSKNCKIRLSPKKKQKTKKNIPNRQVLFNSFVKFSLTPSYK